MRNEISLEEQILAAAEELFVERGFAATSTTDIARKVGCNQALVHYYFRTKDKLFEQIFFKKFEYVLSCVNTFQFSGAIEELLKEFVTMYFDFLKQLPHLPFFILNELIMNEKRREFIRKNIIENQQRQAVFSRIDEMVQNEVKKGTIRPIETLDLLINIVSLTVSSFIALPIYADWLQKNDQEVAAFIEHRKHEVITMLINGLKA